MTLHGSQHGGAHSPNYGNRVGRANSDNLQGGGGSNVYVASRLLHASDTGMPLIAIL